MAISTPTTQHTMDLVPACDACVHAVWMPYIEAESGAASGALRDCGEAVP